MKKSFWIKVVLLIILAASLRFYKLGQVPAGMTWDEAAIAYNGQAILTARRDEWLNKLPISFRSFGDYKAPFAIYLNGPFTYVFGNNLWAVRLPFVLISLSAILGMTLFTNEFLISQGFKKNQAKQWALFSGFLIALSPWHLHYSRVGFESCMALSFIFFGLYFLFFCLNNLGKNKTLWKLKVNVAYVSMFLSILFFSLSLYTYHSAKITTPLLVLGILFWKNKIFIKNKILSVLSFVWGILVLWPLIWDSFHGLGGTRFTQASIFGLQISSLERTQVFFSNFVAHLNPDFLIFGANDTLRHGDGNWGVLFSTTLILVLLSLYFLKKSKKSIVFFSLYWILVGLIPAAIGREVPHPNRAILALPGFLILAINGFFTTISYLQKRWSVIESKIFVGIFFFIHIALFIAYQNHYYNVYAKESVSDFNEGYLEAFNYVLPYEKGLDGKQKVDQVVFTSKYGHPYIYALFVRKTNPIWYQGGSLNTYLFIDKINEGDLARNNTIVVAAPDDLPNIIPDKYILANDGSVRFKIYINQQ